MKAVCRRVDAAIEALHRGDMIILTDDSDRENEGDLIFPAETITPQVINFMRRHCSGIICFPVTQEKADQLALPLMVNNTHNNSRFGTAFTLSIEAREGITTGVSADDRAHTIRTAMKENVSTHDIVKPGHVFPLIAKSGGVLERPGHTEGSVDLMRLAGFKPAAVLCEVMNEDGTMAHGADLQAFAERFDLVSVSVSDLIHYRRLHEVLIREAATTTLQLAHYGEFHFTVFEDTIHQQEIMVLHKKNQTNEPLVRVHSSCFTGDILGSLHCDCHTQLQHAVKAISEEGGFLIYLNQEGRGIGLVNKIKAYALQREGMDTVEANTHLGLPQDARDYYLAAQVLAYFKQTQIRLLTNNPDKVNSLESYGITVKRAPMKPAVTEHNKTYLHTKQTKLQHVLEI